MKSNTKQHTAWNVKRSFKNFHMSFDMQNLLNSVNTEHIVSGDNGHYKLILDAVSYYLLAKNVSKESVAKMLEYYSSKVALVKPKAKATVKKTVANVVEIATLNKDLENYFLNNLKSKAYNKYGQKAVKLMLYDHIKKSCDDLKQMEQLKLLIKNFF